LQNAIVSFAARNNLWMYQLSVVPGVLVVVKRINPPVLTAGDVSVADKSAVAN